MKIMKLDISACMLSGLIITFALVGGTTAYGQAVDPNKTAKAEVMRDAEFVTINIRDNEDAVFLSQKAADRGTEIRLKELAQTMIENHSAMLYQMQQLQSAGTGTSKQQAGSGKGSPAAADLNYKLARTPGEDFDTTWIQGVLAMQEAKYQELVQAKETVRNSQLKMAITDAIPLVRKEISELKSIYKYLLKSAIQKKKEAAARAKQAKQK